MKFLKTILAFPLIFILGESAMAQVQRSMTFDANTNLILREFTAMLVQNEDEIQVEMRMGGQTAGTETDQLQRGDIILMMNGTRAESIMKLRELYDALADNEEISVGVRRGDERFIVRANKGEFPETPGMQMVMSVDSDDGAPPVVVAELGLVLSLIEGQIQIQALIEPLMPDELKTDDLEGFQIVTINGQRFEEVSEVQSFIADLAVGSQIDLVVQRDGDQKVITFAKQEARGAVNMSIDG